MVTYLHEILAMYILLYIKINVTIGGYASLMIIVGDSNECYTISYKSNLISGATLSYADHDVEALLSLIDNIVNQVNRKDLLTDALAWRKDNLLNGIIKVI